MDVMSGACRSLSAWNNTWIRKKDSSSLQTIPASHSHFISIFSWSFSPAISKKPYSEAKGMLIPLMWTSVDVMPLSGALAFGASSLTREWKAWRFHSLLEQVGERSCRARGSNIPKRPAHGQLVTLERAISQLLSCSPLHPEAIWD